MPPFFLGLPANSLRWGTKVSPRENTPIDYAKDTVDENAQNSCDCSSGKYGIHVAAMQRNKKNVRPDTAICRSKKLRGDHNDQAN
jgi:hypothetical protein